ncbi:MAG: hypothetical protein ACRECH_08835 [Nitrososphaerales archaeon]
MLSLIEIRASVPFKVELDAAGSGYIYSADGNIGVHGRIKSNSLNDIKDLAEALRSNLYEANESQYVRQSDGIKMEVKKSNEHHDHYEIKAIDHNEWICGSPADTVFLLNELREILRQNSIS